MKTYKRDCRECGTCYTTPTARKKFCSVPCEKAFNNRRMRRGAILYDLFMASRYQTREFSATELRSIYQRLGMRFREEDVNERAGRHSWLPVPDTLEKIDVVDRAVGKSYQRHERFGRAA